MDVHVSAADDPPEKPQRADPPAIALLDEHHARLTRRLHGVSREQLAAERRTSENREAAIKARRRPG